MSETYQYVGLFSTVEILSGKNLKGSLKNCNPIHCLAQLQMEIT